MNTPQHRVFSTPQLVAHIMCSGVLCYEDYANICRVSKGLYDASQQTSIQNIFNMAVLFVSGRITGAGGSIKDVYAYRREDEFVPKFLESRSDTFALQPIVSFVKVCCGPSHALAISNEGELFSWGRNEEGQLGLGDLFPRSIPTLVEITQNENKVVAIDKITCGKQHSLALKKDGTLYSFGNCANGRTGEKPMFGPNRLLRPTIVEYFIMKRPVAISARNTYSLVVTIDGDVYLMGTISDGCVHAVRPWKAYEAEEYSTGKAINVAAGGEHALILTENGTVLSFGRKHRGRLGLGLSGEEYQNDPQDIKGLEDVVHVAAGEETSFVITKDGCMFSWGGGGVGTLGIGDIRSSQFSPVKVLDTYFPTFAHGERIEKVSSGFLHTILLTSKGRVLSFGCGAFGRLGTGSEFDVVQPSPVTTFNDTQYRVVDIAAGFQNSLFVVSYKKKYILMKD